VLKYDYMAIPKNRKYNNLLKKAGKNSDQWDQFIQQNKQNLPRDVDIIDIDGGFIDYIGDNLVFGGGLSDLRSYFFGIQRWNEFTQLWQNSDKYKNIEIPFIFINRDKSPEVGSNPVDYKIPVRKTFPYAKIPTWDANRNGMDIYSIPNPVGVDITYKMVVVSFKISQLNVVNKKISELFASAQTYVNIKGHYFPMLLESSGDESQIDDLDGKRFYVQTYDIRVQGYIVDSEEFEIKPAISRMFVITETIVKKTKPIIRRVYTKTDTTRSITIIFRFTQDSYDELYFISEDNINVSGISTDNITSFVIKINDVEVNTPFTLRKDDVVYMGIARDENQVESEIHLIGTVK